MGSCASFISLTEFRERARGAKFFIFYRRKDSDLSRVNFLWLWRHLRRKWTESIPMKIILGNDSLGKKENLLAPSSYKNSGQISIALLCEVAVDHCK